MNDARNTSKINIDPRVFFFKRTARWPRGQADRRRVGRRTGGERVRPHLPLTAAGGMTSGHRDACPPATRRVVHSSSAVQKVDGGVTVWGIAVGSNCQIALPVFGTLFLAVGLVLTGTCAVRTVSTRARAQPLQRCRRYRYR